MTSTSKTIKNYAVVPSTKKPSFFCIFLSPLFLIPTSSVPLEKYTMYLKGEYSVLNCTTQRTVMQNNNIVSKVVGI